MHVAATDPRLTWLGAVDRQADGDGVRCYRLPYADRDLFHPDLWNTACATAGVRVVFRAATRVLGLRVGSESSGKVFALVRDGEHVGDVVAGADAALRFPDQDGAEHGYEIWLPQNAPTRVIGLDVDDAHAVLRSAAPARRWLHYGSSISHCNGADSPVHTWPARVARARKLDLVCFGFAGQCHLDPLVARVMSRQAADAISLKVGINIYGKASLNARSFRWNLIAAVRLIREAHPTVPLAVISPVFSPVREALINRADFTLAQMRDEVQAAVTALRAHGDHHLRYLDGLNLLGPADRDRLPDFLHPDTEGYRLMAERFDAQLGNALFG